ncbi:MAG: MarR family transcriptional regulator [Bacillota bacterium]|nr:MarR family transcriptional regulator [Bacillota bacterium]
MKKNNLNNIKDKLELADRLIENIPYLQRRVFSGIKNGGLSRQKMNLLIRVRNKDGMPMKYYIEKLNIKKSNFTKLSNDLIEQGYLERKINPKDRRSIILTITEKGRSTMSKERKDIRNAFYKKIQSLSEKEISNLNNSLETILDIFDAIE